MNRVRIRSSSKCMLAFVHACLMSISGSVAGASDTVDLHDVRWHVHTDLVTPAEDLAYWQGVIDDQLALANPLLEGGQGPIDAPCCARIEGSAPLSVFGSPGDGYDVIDSQTEQNNLNNLFGGPGSNAYLVDSINFCGTVAPNSLGCAVTPGCSGNGNDNPSLWMIVTVDALDSATLPVVIVHERGHNACLNHTSTHACQIMQGTITTPGMGGCFTASECSNFRNGRTTTSSGLECACHATPGLIEADATSCSVTGTDFCSGGVCGELAGDAAVRLIASAHPGSASIPAPDDALTISGLTGEWSNLGQITPTAQDVQGLAYARDSQQLFGVIPTTGNDSIVTIDPASGDLIATVGTIANGPAELISMAYHPGATSSPSDDRLIMMEVSGAGGLLVWIDPAAPSNPKAYGVISVGPAAEFKGLAYDSIHGKLFAATPIGPNGLYEINLASCPPSPCNASQVVGADGLFVFEASLAFSVETGMLYQVGTAYNGSRVFYNVIDPQSGASVQTLSLDEFTPGGLAAVPEPGCALGLLTGCLGLFASAHRRRSSLSRRRGV